MSDIFAHVSRLYRHGQAGEAPELFEDQRLAGVTTFRPAAVLFAITDKPEPGVLLLHRPSSMRAHPGEIAFPGGKIDAGETPVEGALREAWEELGIRPDVVRVIGEGDLYHTHSGFAITPVIGVIPADIEIIPNPLEVARWFEVPLSFLLDPANHHEQWVEWEGSRRRYYEINWDNERTWGITAALIVNLSRRLRWGG